MQSKTTYSLDQLQEMAVEHFKELGVNVLHATVDGQFFLLKNRAMLHAGAGGVTYEIVNEVAAAIREEAPSLDEMREAVELVHSVDGLRKMMLDEVAGPNRAEVLSVIDARLVQLLSAPATRDEKPAEPKAAVTSATMVPGDPALNPPDAKPVTTTETLAADASQKKEEATQDSASGKASTAATDSTPGKDAPKAQTAAEKKAAKSAEKEAQKNASAKGTDSKEEKESGK